MRFVVIGGGISGVSCALELANLVPGDESDAAAQAERDFYLTPQQIERRKAAAAAVATNKSTAAAATAAAAKPPQHSIILITPSPTVKAVSNVSQLTKHIEVFDVIESSHASLSTQSRGRVKVIHASVLSVDTKRQCVVLDDAKQTAIPYDKLGLCSGARPRLLSPSPHVIGIRDTESVSALARRLSTARRVLVVGNGGIAMELVHALTALQFAADRTATAIVWCIKDKFLGHTFLDHTASAFVLPLLFPKHDPLPAGTTAATAATSSAAAAAAIAAVAPSASAAAAADVKSDSMFDAEPKFTLITPSTHSRAPIPVSASPATATAAAATTDAAAGSELTVIERGESDTRADVERGRAFTQSVTRGGGLGPEWTDVLRKQAAATAAASGGGSAVLNPDIDLRRPNENAAQPNNLTLEFATDITQIIELADPQAPASTAATRPFPLRVVLRNGHSYECDFVVSATGVIPNTEFLGKEFTRGPAEEESPVQTVRANTTVAPSAAAAAAAAAVAATAKPDSTIAAPATAATAATAASTSTSSGVGGVLIDEHMRTSVRNVYAAGDCAHANFGINATAKADAKSGGGGGGGGGAESDSDEMCHWFQMKLWSQAKTMGVYCARAMAKAVVNQQMRIERTARVNARGKPAAATAAAAASADPTSDDDEDDDYGFYFELFAHATRFFGMKVVLLGRYNGQGMGVAGSDHQILMRCEPGPTGQYVKLVVSNAGRLVGATLIGDTDLEETFENLILNRLDISRFGENILHPDIDLEAYFD